jgi:hypothetical protein
LELVRVAVQKVCPGRREHQDAPETFVPTQVVAGAWAAQVAAHLRGAAHLDPEGVDCHALCRATARDCRWARADEQVRKGGQQAPWFRSAQGQQATRQLDDLLRACPQSVQMDAPRKEMTARQQGVEPQWAVALMQEASL